MAAMTWDPEAERALKDLPFVVRPLVRRKVEERAVAAGQDQVSLAVWQEAEARYRAVRGGRGQAEMAKLLPQANAPGVEMVVVEACRAQLSGCPNALLDTEPWRRAVDGWLRDEGVHERLRARVADDQVLFHHKLKISLSGCPNGCSRPQIADLAVVGAVEPRFDASACTACGACVAACPDGALGLGDLVERDAALCQGCQGCRNACAHDAVSHGAPFARLWAGGKLGRHPHLARPVGRADEPRQSVDFMRRALDDYLREAPPGMRFAAWWSGRE